MQPLTTMITKLSFIKSTNIAALSTLLTLTISPIVQANIAVTFTESAPKDYFVISNTSSCIAQNIVVSIDLQNSAGQLIFDTTSQGADVEVFQPFEVKEGNIQLNTNTIKDGQSALAITIQGLQPQSSASFTIDVDDTLKNSSLGNIRVAGNEIAGGEVQVQMGEFVSSLSLFGGDSRADVTVPICEISSV